ncbi:MAG: Calx-beta domain-containing protein [Patescibacteria group bacterium]|nr:Calx-beta domain-containing protein [Patescibacteria group bacterium]MDD5715446.1 Calx-beta domain-containing protein [Patescibacteria group bacterium]
MDTKNGITQWLAQARQAGLSNEQISGQLKAAGWSTEQINQTLHPLPLIPSAHDIAEHISPTKSRKRISKKTAVLVSVGAFVLLLIGGGVFAYMKGYLPLPFLSKDAQDLLMKSFTKLGQAKSGEVGFTFEVVAEDRAEGLEPIAMENSSEDTPSEKASQNAQLNSDASQIRTGLVLYADDNQSTYPATLAPLAPAYLSKLPTQPDNKPFVYTVAADKKSYTLSFSCVTGDVKTGTFDSEGNSTMCTSSSDTAFDVSMLSYVDELVNALPTDLRIFGDITVFMNYAKDAKEEQQGIVTAKGGYSSSGMTVSIDGEVRIKNGKTYAIIREFPSFFMADISAISNKWIEYDPDENSSLDSFDFQDITNSFTSGLPAMEDENVKNKLKAEIVPLTTTAFDTGLFTAVRDGSETLNNHPTHKVKITIDPSKIPAFAEKYRAGAKERNADLSSDALKPITKVIDAMNKPEVITQLTEFFKNVHLTAWIDQSGNDMRKLTATVIIVPPDKYEKFNEKQVRFTIGFTFDHLGEQPSVDVPNDTISADEAERLLSGKTVEEQQFEKQRRAVDSIRSALGQYYQIKQTYPENLNDLLENRPAATNSNTNSNNFYSAKKTVPTDAYSSKSFAYASTGSDYTLTYTIKFPTGTSENSYTLDYYKGMYVDGTNTATKNFLSKEAEANKDSDNDGLSDTEETRYGTNKYLRDTDGDGYTDKEEIDAGYDPLTRSSSSSSNVNTTVPLTALPEAYLNTQNHHYPESSGTVNIPISLTTSSSEDVSVEYNIVGGEATNAVDYSLPVHGTVTIPANAKEAQLSFQIIDDTDVEAGESIIIELVDAENAQVIRSNKQYRKTIIIETSDGPEPYCTDSDGGNVYDVFGEVKYFVYGHNEEWSFPDTCREEKNGTNVTSGQYIVEQNCYGSQGSNQPNTSGSASIVECPGGCLNGVCAGKD